MNQDQVKKRLLRLENDAKDFSLIFTGKNSGKVNGLYKPESKEILIHNKNFENDESLMYAAIHEFAHHIQFTTSVTPVPVRSHNTFFMNLFHTLLAKAEKVGTYRNIFKSDPEFVALTKIIKEKYLSGNGELMLEFGKMMQKASNLCSKHNVSFDDYMDRELRVQRSTAKTIMKCSELNINPEIGFDNMKIVADIKDETIAKEAEKAFMQGQTPKMVKMNFTTKPQPEDRLEYLLQEKERLAASIDRLLTKVDEVDAQIKNLKKDKGD